MSNAHVILFKPIEITEYEGSVKMLTTCILNGSDSSSEIYLEDSRNKKFAYTCFMNYLAIIRFKGQSELVEGIGTSIAPNKKKQKNKAEPIKQAEVISPILAVNFSKTTKDLQFVFQSSQQQTRPIFPLQMRCESLMEIISEEDCHTDNKPLYEIKYQIGIDKKELELLFTSLVNKNGGNVEDLNEGKKPKTKKKRTFLSKKDITVNMIDQKLSLKFKNYLAKVIGRRFLFNYIDNEKEGKMLQLLDFPRIFGFHLENILDNHNKWLIMQSFYKAIPFYPTESDTCFREEYPELWKESVCRKWVIDGVKKIYFNKELDEQTRNYLQQYSNPLDICIHLAFCSQIQEDSPIAIIKRSSSTLEISSFLGESLLKAQNTIINRGRSFLNKNLENIAFSLENEDSRKEKVGSTPLDNYHFRALFSVMTGQDYMLNGEIELIINCLNKIRLKENQGLFIYPVFNYQSKTSLSCKKEEEEEKNTTQTHSEGGNEQNQDDGKRTNFRHLNTKEMTSLANHCLIQGGPSLSIGSRVYISTNYTLKVSALARLFFLVNKRHTFIKKEKTLLMETRDKQEVLRGDKKRKIEEISGNEKRPDKVTEHTRDNGKVDEFHELLKRPISCFPFYFPIKNISFQLNGMFGHSLLVISKNLEHSRYCDTYYDLLNISWFDLVELLNHKWYSIFDYSRPLRKLCLNKILGGDSNPCNIDGCCKWEESTQQNYLSDIFKNPSQGDFSPAMKEHQKPVLKSKLARSLSQKPNLSFLAHIVVLDTDSYGLMEITNLLEYIYQFSKNITKNQQPSLSGILQVADRLTFMGNCDAIGSTIEQKVNLMQILRSIGTMRRSILSFSGRSPLIQQMTGEDFVQYEKNAYTQLGYNLSDKEREMDIENISTTDHLYLDITETPYSSLCSLHKERSETNKGNLNGGSLLSDKEDIDQVEENDSSLFTFTSIFPTQKNQHSHVGNPEMPHYAIIRINNTKQLVIEDFLESCKSNTNGDHKNSPIGSSLTQWFKEFSLQFPGQASFKILTDYHELEDSVNLRDLSREISKFFLKLPVPKQKENTEDKKNKDNEFIYHCKKTGSTYFLEEDREICKIAPNQKMLIRSSIQKLKQIGNNQRGPPFYYLVGTNSWDRRLDYFPSKYPVEFRCDQLKNFKKSTFLPVDHQISTSAHQVIIYFISSDSTWANLINLIKNCTHTIVIVSYEKKDNQYTLNFSSQYKTSLLGDFSKHDRQCQITQNKLYVNNTIIADMIIERMQMYSLKK